jgi:glycyl-radical enzyme activating protein
VSSATGTIFDIQGFSVYDGPGCRTLIFLKGCPMRCKWCENPEGRHSYREPMYDKEKCLFGGECERACPYNAISIKNNVLTIERDKCKNCNQYSCAEVCDTGALKIAGYRISVDELMTRIDRERNYWGAKGGITLTGGEPFLQADFTFEILKRCHEKYINTAIETCANVPWENIEKSLDFIDWMFFDIKHMEIKKHKQGTGCSNYLIKKNFIHIAEKFEQRLIARMVIIPGYNDSDEYVKKFAEFINGTGRKQKEVNILPLHHLAREKFKMLDKEYFSKSLEVPSKTKLKQVKDIIESFGIKCYIGENTPF